MAKSLINQLKWKMFLTITLSPLPPELMMESTKQGNLLLITWEENLNLLLFLSPTDTTEIECTVAEFKNGKALSPYSSLCNLLKLLSLYVSSARVILIDEPFTTGISPDKLKVAKVIGRVHLTTRLIIDLFLFCLSLAKYLYKRLYKFLEINEILHPLQFGFRKNHSASHTLISMTETIKENY